MLRRAFIGLSVSPTLLVVASMSENATDPEGREDPVPALSVVMPVHNALPHLDDAIESIIAQTFSDFEFVILDDASTDGSSERLHYWAARDPRIRLLRADKNLGPVQSSNVVARAARAPLVARMDADDISCPERLAEQVQLLTDHPHVGVVGCLSDMIDVSGRKIRDTDQWRLVRRSAFLPFAHGAIMYRREIFERLTGYRDECQYWEDQDLVWRAANFTEIAVIPRTLFRHRQWTSTRFVCDPGQLEQAVDRVYQVADRLKAGKNWIELPSPSASTAHRLDPRAIISVGSVHLWAGAHPRLFRRFLRQGKLSWNVSTLKALVWTAWASANPASLRGFLRLLLKSRNVAAASALDTSAPVTWRPHEPSRSLKKAGPKL